MGKVGLQVSSLAVDWVKDGCLNLEILNSERHLQGTAYNAMVHTMHRRRSCVPMQIAFGHSWSLGHRDLRGAWSPVEGDAVEQP